MLPSFNLNKCLEYFTKTLTAIYPNKLFHIPSWIPKLADPVIQFDLQPPTYRQVTNIIRRMKASGCPCPLDQISIICFKRCPFLRSYLTDLIQAVWSSGSIPSEWKKACTILIHKKGDTNTPSNFRPITLENIPLKVFTSCVRSVNNCRGSRVAGRGSRVKSRGSRVKSRGSRVKSRGSNKREKQFIHFIIMSESNFNCENIICSYCFSVFFNRNALCYQFFVKTTNEFNRCTETYFSLAKNNEQ